MFLHFDLDHDSFKSRKLVGIGGDDDDGGGNGGGAGAAADDDGGVPGPRGGGGGNSVHGTLGKGVNAGNANIAAPSSGSVRPSTPLDPTASVTAHESSMSRDDLLAQVILKECE